MEAVCPDVSQNLACLHTCHVMFLDVATTMLRKFMYFPSVFVFPQPFLCKCALALLVKEPINLNSISHVGGTHYIVYTSASADLNLARI